MRRQAPEIPRAALRLFYGLVARNFGASHRIGSGGQFYQGLLV